MATDFESLCGDFVGSQQFLFLPAELAEHAQDLLGAFVYACSARGVISPGDFSIVHLESVMTDHIARLDLPLQVRKSVPSLLRAFFGYIAQSGNFPPAQEWIEWVTILEKKYHDKFRDDGTVKGETFRKKYADVNRNDPCPCGSGKKFKKCCMGLIG